MELIVTNGFSSDTLSKTSFIQIDTAVLSEAGPSGDECDLDYTLGASTADGTGVWSQLSGPGTSVFTNLNDSNATVIVSAYGAYVFSWTVTKGTCSASDSVAVLFSEFPSANAGSDLNICSSNSAQLSGGIGGGATSGVWTSLGTGTLNDSSLLNAVYTPSGLDISTGYVGLVLTTDDPFGACPATTDSLLLTIDLAATTSAGVDDTICEGDIVNLVGTMGGSATSTIWTTAAGGLFGDSSSLSTSYTPSALDINSGIALLSLTTNDPLGICPAVVDTVSISIDLMPTANAGVDLIICSGVSPALAGSIGGGASSSLWTSSGSGVFGDPSLLSSTYSPSPTDIIAGSVILWLSTDDPAGPCIEAKDSMILTIDKSTTIDSITYSDETKCGLSDGSINISASGGIPPLWYSIDSGLTYYTTGNITGLSSGTYYLQVTNSSLCSSAMQTVIIAEGVAPSPPALPSDTTYCSGVPMLDLVVAPSMGSTITWYTDSALSIVFDTGTTVSPDTSSGTTTYFVTTSLYGCESVSNSTSITIFSTSSISGQVLDSITPVVAGIVKLREYNPNPTLMQDIDSTTIDSLGYYSFTNVPFGSYLVIARADTSLYSDLVATYHDSTNHWQKATILNTGCQSLVSADIHLIDFATSIAYGKVSGTIKGGPLKQGFDFPREDIDITLERVGDSLVMNYAISDSQGKYSFSNIDFGSYYVYVDVPGLNLDDTYTITFDVVLAEYTDLDFCLDTFSIYACELVSIENMQPVTQGVNVYPNPFTDGFTVEFELKYQMNVEISVYNLLGEYIATLEQGLRSAGHHSIAMDNAIVGHTEGIYVLKLNLGESSIMKRIIRTK